MTMREITKRQNVKYKTTFNLIAGLTCMLFVLVGVKVEKHMACV